MARQQESRKWEPGSSVAAYNGQQPRATTVGIPVLRRVLLDGFLTFLAEGMAIRRTPTQHFLRPEVSSESALERELAPHEGPARSSPGGSLRKLEVKPVAYGLKAVEAIVVVEDAGGEMERLEKALRGIPGVGGVEATEVTLL